MARIDRFGFRLAAALAAVLALAVTDAQARGFGGGYHGGAIGARVGAWGRPPGPIRPGPGLGWRGRQPGYALRPGSYARRWYGSYGYGLAGLGLGFGLGGVFGDPFYGDDDVYAGPVYTPPVYTSPIYTSPIYTSPAYGAPADIPVQGAIPAADAAAIAACARRLKTYDPATQTYIGKGYVRRYCP